MKELKCLYFDFIKEKAYLKIISWWGRTVTFRLSCISRRADRGFKPKSFSLPPRLFPPGRACGRFFPSGRILNYLDWWFGFLRERRSCSAGRRRVGPVRQGASAGEARGRRGSSVRQGAPAENRSAGRPGTGPGTKMKRRTAMPERGGVVMQKSIPDASGCRIFRPFREYFLLFSRLGLYA